MTSPDGKLEISQPSRRSIKIKCPAVDKKRFSSYNISAFEIDDSKTIRASVEVNECSFSTDHSSTTCENLQCGKSYRVVVQACGNDTEAAEFHEDFVKGMLRSAPSFMYMYHDPTHNVCYFLLSS